MSKSGYVYIMANDRPTLYAGVTSDLVKRVWEHKNNVVPGFTARYKIHKLVYYETIITIEMAIVREKQIKDMNREEKLTMIKQFNPEFKDLYNDIII